MDDFLHEARETTFGASLDLFKGSNPAKGLANATVRLAPQS